MSDETFADKVTRVLRDEIAYWQQRDATTHRVLCGLRDRLAASPSQPVAPATPIPMLMFCPRCNAQHIDEPKGDWTNPPHKTHTCQACGARWRHCDTWPTTGVASLADPGRDVVDPAPSPATPPAGEPMLLMVPPRAGAVVRAAMKWREWARKLERTAPEDEDCELIAAVDAFLAGRDPEERP